MAEPFTLELPDGLRWVIEPPADPHGDGHVRTARVSIQANGLEARTIATLSDGPWNPADFFAELAAGWLRPALDVARRLEDSGAPPVS